MGACVPGVGDAMVPLQKMGQEEICAPVESGVAKTGLSGAKREGRKERREVGRHSERLDASYLVQLRDSPFFHDWELPTRR